MAEVKQVKTVCRNCHGGCGVIAHVRDGKVVKVEGDPDSPISHGSMCAKGLAVTQMAYHPDRILHPMKKIGGDWQRISWDEALDTVAGKFKEAREKYGAESILIGQGTGRDFESHFSRLGNMLGTPNMITAGHMCYLSRIAATLTTCGRHPAIDYAGDPRCIVMWGCNPLWTNPDEYKGVSFWRAYQKGAKLIVIDPRKGFLAKRADLWLQVRPGTDAALALGFHNVIIEEELYDKEFVSQYVHGWDEFVERVKNDYPLDLRGGNHLGRPGSDSQGGPAVRHHQTGRHPLGCAYGTEHQLHRFHPGRRWAYGGNRKPGRAGRQCIPPTSGNPLHSRILQPQGAGARTAGQAAWWR